MHSLQSLLCGSFSTQGGLKLKKSFEKIVYLLPGKCWIAETAAKRPNGFARRNSGQGRSLGGDLEKNRGKKTAEIDWDFKKCRQNAPNIPL